MTTTIALSRDEQTRRFATDEDLAWLADTMARQYVAGGEVRTFWGPGHQELIDEFPDEWQAAIERARAKALPRGTVSVDDRELIEKGSFDDEDPRAPKPGDRLDGRTYGGNGRPKPAPRGPIEKDPNLVPTVEEILEIRGRLGRKFEPGDLTPGLRAAAIAFLTMTKHEPGSWALEVAIKVARDGKISDGQAKGALNVLTARRPSNGVRSTETVQPKVELTEGMYAKDGRFYRVLRSREGRLYAKELIETDGRPEFVYARGAIFELTPEDRMTLEQAAEYGQIHGWCCVCGKHLTNPKSVAAGIGPVCAKNV